MDICHTKQLHRIENGINELLLLGKQIMSIISDFQIALDAYLANLKADIQALNDKISALQASQGALSAADQASLDEIQASAKALSDSSANPPVLPPAASAAAPAAAAK